MVNVKTTLFCVKNLIIKLKKDKKELGFEPQIFSNFPAHDLNFLKGENDEIKSRRGSSNFSTLLVKPCFEIKNN